MMVDRARRCAKITDAVADGRHPVLDNWTVVESGPTPTAREGTGGAVHDGEFDPGSGRTLAACLMHASRADSGGNPRVSGGRVRNTWGTDPGVGTSVAKVAVMPHTAARGHARRESGNAPEDGPAAH